MLSASFINSIDKEQYARQSYFSFGDYVLNLSSNAIKVNKFDQTSVQQENPLSTELMSSLGEVKGVKGVISFNQLSLEYTYNDVKADDVSAHFDHRSYKRQGIDKTPSVHIGVAATQMEQRGIATDKAISAVKLPHKTSCLMKSRQELHGSTTGLKGRKSNRISSMAELHQKITAMQSDYYALRDKIVNAEKEVSHTAFFTFRTNRCKGMVFAFVRQGDTISKACDYLLQEVNFQSRLDDELIIFLKSCGDFYSIFCHSFRSAKS